MSLLDFPGRFHARRSFPRPPVTILLGALAILAGCVTIDGILKADGSGTVDVSYQVPPTSSETIEKRRFTSPQVKLESFTLKPDGMATAKLSFDDPAKLSTTEIFKNVTIKRQREGEEERLTITHSNPTAKEGKDTGKPGPRINITFPGKVLEANRNAKVEGNRVSWSFGLAEFLKEKSLDLTARYRISPDAPPDAGAAPKESGEQKPPAGK